jgi:hypothetical protein
VHRGPVRSRTTAICFSRRRGQLISERPSSRSALPCRSHGRSRSRVTEAADRTLATQPAFGGSYRSDDLGATDACAPRPDHWALVASTYGYAPNAQGDAYSTRRMVVMSGVGVDVGGVDLLVSEP